MNIEPYEYSEKLLDPRWKRKRFDIISRDDFKCVICNYRGKLHVHHRQYHFSEINNSFINPWEYEDHLLITLCKWCHKKGHKMYVIPIIKVK
jgi:5-methylcytosine-specific restriction endonuclease McrA